MIRLFLSILFVCSASADEFLAIADTIYTGQSWAVPMQTPSEIDNAFFRKYIESGDIDLRMQSIELGFANQQKTLNIKLDSEFVEQDNGLKLSTLKSYTPGALRGYSGGLGDLNFIFNTDKLPGNLHGGIKAKFTKGKSQLFVLPGQENVGAVVYFPSQQDIRHVGFLLCPFQAPAYKRAGNFPAKADFDLKQIKVKFSALLEGQVTTGVGPGRANSSLNLITSSGSELIESDEVVGRYPFTDINQFNVEKTYPINTQRDQLELRLDVALHNSFNELHTVQVSTGYKFASLPIKKAWSAKYGEDSYMLTGKCFSFIRSLELFHKVENKNLEYKTFSLSDVAREQQKEIF